jgi:hypothetical protein
MPHTSRVELGHAFCSYCGCPPMGPWRVRAHRVCMRCQMGVVLKAPAGTEPRYDDPFVIVDRKLAVQAVSRRAEAALSVEEPAGLDAPLEEFLTATTTGASWRHWSNSRSLAPNRRTRSNYARSPTRRPGFKGGSPAAAPRWARCSY